MVYDINEICLISSDEIEQINAEWLFLLLATLFYMEI